MISRVDYSKRFQKQLVKSPKSIKIEFRKRIETFTHNPFNSKLNNHELTGKFKGFRSINITGDWRAIYFQLKKNEIKFVLLGTHSQLYG